MLLTQDKLDAMIIEYHRMVNAIKEMPAKMVIGIKQYNRVSRLHYLRQQGVSDPIIEEAIRRAKPS
ncbi:hypothetical protein PVA17_13110 [Lysinibacillus sp. CNPSo 3705]|uniref:hypothetical protein n=1 Tax=Lysinibacillus sp. CNPSo 3705 TaxID=3028148 RepID=UPI0023635275|nr:hypothetical protein [Lysinibacillus sp. CNPSo 3705]MDD1503697.1 hypothetical protein [Lysinibacillus sp. CNPSo 3705]